MTEQMLGTFDATIVVPFSPSILAGMDILDDAAMYTNVLHIT